MKTCMIVVFIVCFAGDSHQLLYQGDACKTSTNEPGVCVKLSLCSSAKELLKKNVYPINCGFEKNIPIVCCPKTEIKYTYLAEEKCYSYKIEAFFVILGDDAKQREFPNMAALGYANNNKKAWLCGGTLISKNFVLTAAHCLNSLQYGSVKWVRLGVIDINEPEYNTYEVIKTVAHPLYKPPLVYHDIGLVQLNENVTITAYIKPACFYMEDTIPEETKLLATGWGLTKVGGNQSNILQKTSLELFSKEECDMNYNNAALKRKLKNGILHDKQICAGGKKIGTDTCQGDSGGPLLIKQNVNDTDIFFVVGVTSFGKSCGFINVPGIYTRVSYYVPWIEQIIWPNE